MGRHPDPKPERIRADWVYVGTLEASALAGVSQHTIQRWIASGELPPALVAQSPVGGRPRKLYRLDHVLALANNNWR